MGERRTPFEWHKVNLDEPEKRILNLIKALSKNYLIIFLSGREDVCRALTEKWLIEHFGINYEKLYMRKTKDYRKDSIIKKEIFMKNILPFYYIEAVFDDRTQVVRMWRDELNLKCLQVADCDF